MKSIMNGGINTTILTHKVFSAIEYVHIMSGGAPYEHLEDTGRTTSRWVHDMLKRYLMERDTTKPILDCQLNELGKIIENDIHVVLVELEPLVPVEFEPHKEYRWFEVPKQYWISFRSR